VVYRYEAAEDILQVTDLYDPREQWASFVLNAIKAKDLFKREVNYIVKDKEIIIVDEFTGRTMPGRRWSDGLHQAIEAKEGVTIQNETVTLASVSYQNFFRAYPKLSGMSGTAVTEIDEFSNIYNMSVQVRCFRRGFPPARVVVASPLLLWLLYCIFCRL
jgi:preprotein translocase subunit SecA